mgnify:CR=1 FL=1
MNMLLPIHENSIVESGDSYYTVRPMGLMRQVVAPRDASDRESVRAARPPHGVRRGPWARASRISARVWRPDSVNPFFRTRR